MLQKVHRLKRQVRGSFFTLKAKLGHREFLGPNGGLMFRIMFSTRNGSEDFSEDF